MRYSPVGGIVECAPQDAAGAAADVKGVVGGLVESVAGVDYREPQAQSVRAEQTLPQ